MAFYSGLRHEPSEETAAARAYRRLKDEILTCQFAPGTALHENDLATDLGMSKTPVREALAMLIHEGFVEVRPRRGYRVTSITLADVREVFHLRLLLEPAAAELAAERATTDQLQQLRALADDDDGSYEELVQRAALFHTVLAEASGDTRLAATLRNLLEEAQRFFFVGLDLGPVLQHHGDEHRELLDALLKGNHHLASEIARRQVETSRMRILDAILASMTDPRNASMSEVTLGGSPKE